MASGRAPVPYFSYGSNLRLERMRERCPEATVVGPARLPGYRLAFTQYSPHTWRGGVADLVQDLDAEVWGLLYAVTAEDLGRLDAAEGYRPGASSSYTRQIVHVEGPGGDIRAAWTYMVPNKRGPFQPTTEYMAILLEAAERWRFPDWYRSFLGGIATAEPAP